MKIKLKDVAPAVDALTLIAGFPLTIDFAWTSAVLRRKLEEAGEIHNEMRVACFQKHATGEKNGAPGIPIAMIEVYKAEIKDIGEHEVEVPDLNLTHTQLREYLSKKANEEHSATIIHGLLPLLKSDEG